MLVNPPHVTAEPKPAGGPPGFGSALVLNSWDPQNEGNPVF
jgi:hypothetical protein